MHLGTLYRRNLSFRWRMHLATMLCVGASATVLTGALLVGDSMRGSLRATALGRLGPVEHALTAPRHVGEALAARLGEAPEFTTRFDAICPLILARGGIEHAGTGTIVARVNVLGVDHRFWSLGAVGQDIGGSGGPGRSVILNEPLARALAAWPGDDVLVRLGRPPGVPAETLLGRRDEAALSLRLTVGAIVPAGGLGSFSLDLTPHPPCNAYVPLAVLQRALKKPERVNAMVVAGRSARGEPAPQHADLLDRLLNEHLRLSDLGLKLYRDDVLGYVALESESLLIEPAVETAAIEAARSMGAHVAGVLTYLANSIAVVRSEPSESRPEGPPASQPAGKREIPYSTVTAIDVNPRSALTSLTLTDGRPAPVLADDDILLNEWAAADLAARPGDRVRLTYFRLGPFGQLRTESAIFALQGITRLEGLGADRRWAPEYEGVTDSPRLADWNPPFPIDLDRIRESDEAYWDRHGPAPKAFVSLSAGQTRWTQAEARFGRLTSIRVARAPGTSAAATAGEFERRLLRALPAATTGLAFEPVRAHALAAARGSTDFGMLFLGFSLFLMASAAMLTALVFRLHVERRSPEIGILLAVGFQPRTVTTLLLAEGALLAAVGAAVGLLGALGYAWLMLTGLRSWWAAAVDAPFLALHARPASVLIGFAASVGVGLLSIAWAVRGLSRKPPRALLAGVISRPPARGGSRPGRVAAIAAVAVMVGAMTLIAMSAAGAVPAAPAFFASGAAMLVGGVVAAAAAMMRPRGGALPVNGPAAVARLGMRNAARYPGRSLLAIGLLASATFIIVAVGAGRRDAEALPGGRSSGTGGFVLLAESAVPILHDLNTADGRKALSLSPACQAALADACVVPFRLRRGDEASCLNPYRPRSPRILGAGEAMLRRGGFTFRSTMARTDEERRNPWMLLNQALPDGAIPAIGDDSTITWALHLGLGQDLVMADERHNEVRLRIVAVLSDSVLQGELVIAEPRFVELFPSIGGYGFFLIEAPPSTTGALARALASDLENYGLDVDSTRQRLGAYLAVQNTYLSAFQTLGGLGMVLGTLGLAAVLLRNTWERRGELALMRALGYRRSWLGLMVLAEHGVLLLAGLAIGGVCGLLAAAPHAAADVSAIPWGSLALTLVGVAATGMLAGLAALIPTLRSPLLPALRTE